MNVLLQFYPGDAVAVLVANVAVQVTAVTSVALVAGRCLAKDNPALRHAVLAAAVICVLLSPALSYLAYRADLAVFPIAVASQGALDSTAAGQPARAPDGLSASTGSQIPPSAAPHRARIVSSERGNLAVEPAAASAASSRRSLGTALDSLRAAGGGLAAIWLAGFFWLSARLVRGCWFLFHLRRDVHLVEPGDARPWLEELLRQTGVRRLPPKW